MIEQMIARARAVERARLGVTPEVIVSLCRYCAAAYVDDVSARDHCGKPACEQARQRCRWNSFAATRLPPPCRPHSRTIRR